MSLNLQNINLQISAGQLRQFPGDPIPQVAFSGRSNVGKSSLINLLLGRKSLARVSSAPGKTITINFYNIDKKLFFVDLPGYGFAKRAPQDKAQWSALTDGYFTKNPCIDRVDLIIQLVDSRIGPTKDDEMMLDFMNGADIPYIIVATKSDKLNKTERQKSFENISSNGFILPDTPIVYFSSLKNEGKNELWSEIYKYTGL